MASEQPLGCRQAAWQLSWQGYGFAAEGISRMSCFAAADDWGETSRGLVDGSKMMIKRNQSLAPPLNRGSPASVRRQEIGEPTPAPAPPSDGRRRQKTDDATMQIKNRCADEASWRNAARRRP